MSAHPFQERPHRTFLALSLPVGIALVAEPLMALADTAFVRLLGSESLAALGVGTTVLSGSFWVFNFLGVATQTEVARALGAGDREGARRKVSTALVLAALFGGMLALLLGACAGLLSTWMGAEASVHAEAVSYLRLRLVGAPAVLLTATAFGALRGLQEMRTPLWIALFANGLNALFDWLLIFGQGPFPALGIEGAAWASNVGQWAGALWALVALHRRLGWSLAVAPGEVRSLLVIGGDLFLRTSLLTAFLVLTTRAATSMGPQAGAAHHAVRQVWLFTALVLDAFAATAQSLVGYFQGAGERGSMRRVARVAATWGLASGVLLTLGMLASTDLVTRTLVPADAGSLFLGAWLVSAWTQPLNAVSFVTDGVHMGTGDYRYLRNAMVLASVSGALAIAWLDEASAGAFTGLWILTGAWILVRAVLGWVRIWPGVGASPFRSQT